MRTMLGFALALTGCLTTYNGLKLTPEPDAPAVEARPGGCNVEVFESGQKPDRKHVDIARVVLEWSRHQVTEQGADGAMKTLKEAACQNGAFFITDLRALTTGAVEGGMVYEATFATLIGDDGKPVNLKARPPAPAPSPAPRGW